MSVDTSVRIMPIIKFKPKPVLITNNIYGCPSCKTRADHNGDFCSMCGHKKTIYEYDIATTIDDWWSVYDRYLDDDSNVFDEDTFHTPGCIRAVLIHNTSKYSKFVDENSYITLLDDTSSILNDFKEEYKLVLEVLEKEGFEPQVLYSCVHICD